MPANQGKSPLALAAEWVSRITTVSLEMVLPGLAGQWLDRRWGTGYLGLVGFAIGLTGGMWHLLRMTGAGSSSAKKYQSKKPPDKPRHDEPAD